MAHRLCKRISSNFLLIALAAVLVLGAVMVACAKSQTTTAPAATTTRATTSAAATTTTSAPAATTTTAPRPTTTAPTSSGPSAADFYKNNLVTLIVPYAPGGSTDIGARLLAYYWTDVTGGRMIVDNRAGAGGITGANYAYAAKPDGLTMGVGIHGATLMAPTLAQDPAVKYDVKKINWIGYTNPEGEALGISVKSPANSLADFSKLKGLKFASSSRSSTTSLGEALVIDVFGLQEAKIVLGYGGAAEALLAAGKGEVDGYTTTSVNLRDAVGKGFIKPPLVSLTPERTPHLPEVPALPELAKLSSEQEVLLKTFAALISGQVFWYQPGVPQDRIDYARSAFDKVVALDAFVKQSKTVFPVWVPPTAGKDYAAQMEKTLAVATPESFNKLLSIVDKYVR